MASKADYNTIGHPVQIVRFATDEFWGDDEFALDAIKLKAVVDRKDIQNMPVVLLSIVGCQRTGKSFLLNYIIRYLSSQERGTHDTWLRDKECPLHGFPWSHGLDRSTEGIIMWNRPFILKQNSGQKVAVFLMDTQGLFDGSFSSTISPVIYALSTIMSSVQTLNLMRTVDEAILQKFELFLETAMIAYNLTFGNKQSPKFQRLVYLIRDWIDPAKYRYGGHGGKIFHQDILQRRDRQSRAPNLSMENIEKCYEQTDCFLMPHPGERACETFTPFTDDSANSEETSDLLHCAFDGRLSQLRTRFRRYLKKLGPFLLQQDELHLKCFGGRIVTGNELFDIFKKCVAIFLSGEIPTPRNTRQILIQEFNAKVLKRTIQKHEQKLVKIYTNMKDGGTLPLPEQLEHAIVEEEKRTKRDFNETVRDPDDDSQPLFRKLENNLAKAKSECLLRLKKDIVKQRNLEKRSAIR